MAAKQINSRLEFIITVFLLWMITSIIITIDFSKIKYYNIDIVL